MHKTVFVGLSGGVDSSVAAKRLIERGYYVVGVFIKTWHPDFIACTEVEDRLDAMRVAAHLNIPFLTFDAESVYRDEVASYMIKEYEQGRTPNPDIMCNKYVKFGAFYSFARAHGADYVATGHYARLVHKNDESKLFRGTDAEKDQSYFLWTLTHEERSHILFPLGESTKVEIRKEAQRANLPTAIKKDSQGVCFLGKIDMGSFLEHYIQKNPGFVKDEDGNNIGTHSGISLYTVGQRHGFTITDLNAKKKPLYVVKKNVQENTITVGHVPPSIQAKTIFIKELCIHETLPKTCEAQFRYRQEPFAVKITENNGHSLALTVVEGSIELPSPGQSCVFYLEDRCLGGGIIESII